MVNTLFYLIQNLSKMFPLFSSQTIKTFLKNSLPPFVCLISFLVHSRVSGL